MSTAGTDRSAAPTPARHARPASAAWALGSSRDTGEGPGWQLVMPVKLLALAKSRLSDLGPARTELALALVLDSVTAALAAPGVRGVLVVTDDEMAARALARPGVRLVADSPRAGLNAALRHGVAQLGSPGAVAALTADLPALRPEDLGRALLECAEHRLAFVPDAEGSGTTMLAASSSADFRPHFGSGSAAAHTAAGAVRVAEGLASLRRDVDTVAGLRAAIALGVGTRTASVLAGLPASVRPAG